MSTLIQYVRLDLSDEIETVFEKLRKASCQADMKYIRLAVSQVAANPDATHLLGLGEGVIAGKIYTHTTIQ